MEFGITLPGNKPFDAVALGLNAVDQLILVNRYPEFNSKIRYLSESLAAGGQSATAMVALSRLGLRTRYIGKVGSNLHGRFQIETLERDGVDISGLIVAGDAETRLSFIIVDQETGERTIIWDRDERLAFLPSEVDRDAVTSGRVLLVDGHDVEASVRAASLAREAGIPVVLDIDNIYPHAEDLLPEIDFIISSSTFPERFTGEPDLPTALRILAERTGSLFVAATLGRDGVLAFFKGRFIHSPAFRIECRDTTGAGDAFHGGFIYGLLAGMSVEDTLTFAHAVAALKCRDLGARTALPVLDEVESLIRTGARHPAQSF